MYVPVIIFAFVFPNYNKMYYDKENLFITNPFITDLNKTVNIIIDRYTEEKKNG